MLRHTFPLCVRLLALAVFAITGSSLAAQDALKVVAWNIEWYPGRSPNATEEEKEAHRKLVKEELRRINPDIFLASEIRNWKEFHDLVSAVPGLHVHVVSNFLSNDTGELWLQQVAIASKLPCQAAWAEAFRPTIPALTRGFAFAALEAPGDRGLILVYALHLKSNRSRNQAEEQTNFRVRNESSRQILHHVEQTRDVTFQSQPIAGRIVGGDFNTNHDGQFGDRVIAMFESAGFLNTWKNTPRDRRMTWRGNNSFPPTTFDYILTLGFPGAEAFIEETADETGDHEAVVLRLSLPGPS
jgi:hypothetical protein